jgi:hypothetical protein
LDGLDTTYELAEYETPLKLDRVTPMVMSVEKHEVAAMLALTGMTILRISEVSGIPVTAIKKWKKHPDFVKLMNDMVTERVSDMRAFRLRNCLKTLDARIEKVEELGDWSLFSTKDSIDIQDSMRKDSEAKEETEQSQYMKTIEALLVKSSRPVVVQIEGGK